MNLNCNSKGEFFGGSTVDGVIKSTDDGLTWKSVSSGLTQYSIYSITFGNDNDVFCSSYGNAVYYSSDSGDNWTPIFINRYVNNVNVLEYKNGILFAGTGSGLFKSFDKGINWQEILIDSNQVSVRLMKINESGHIFIVTFGNEIYRSQDEGVTWTQINSGLTELNITAIGMTPVGYVFLGTGKGEIYRSTQVMTSIEEIESVKPAEYVLSQNYPNPFNPTTGISYTIPEAGLVNITVYDMLGQKMVELVNEQMAPGSYKVKFDAGSFTSGIYLYKISVNNFMKTKKMMLTK